MTKKKSLNEITKNKPAKQATSSEVAASGAPSFNIDEVYFKVKDNNEIEIDTERMRPFKVFFATPCYGGMITDQYFLSMFRTSQMLMQHGIDFRITTLRNESLITRARNILTAMFLADKSMTHLMFIDADIEWEPDSVLRLLAMNKPIIAGAYPKKTVDWGAIRKAASLGETDLENFQAEYAINLKFVDPERRQINVHNGAVELLDASTGFFLIKREVIEKLVEAMGEELHYNNDTALQDPEISKYCYALFDCIIDPIDRRYLSEDYTFCRRAQSIGQTVWLDPNTNLNHIGAYTFKGNIGRLFKKA